MPALETSNFCQALKIKMRLVSPDHKNIVKNLYKTLVYFISKL